MHVQQFVKYLISNSFESHLVYLSLSVSTLFLRLIFRLFFFYLILFVYFNMHSHISFRTFLFRFFIFLFLLLYLLFNCRYSSAFYHLPFFYSLVLIFLLYLSLNSTFPSLFLGVFTYPFFCIKPWGVRIHSLFLHCSWLSYLPHN